MSLFPIVDGRARFDASGNVDSDRYSAGIRYTQEGAARSQSSAGTYFNQGIPMSSTGQVALVDASSGLPADVIWLSGLPISGNRVCISNKPVSVVSSGIPYDSAGAIAATVAPITDLPTLDLVFAGPVSDPPNTGPTLDLNFTAQTYQIGIQYAVWDNDRNASLPAAISVLSIVLLPTSTATAAFALNTNGTFASTPAGTSGTWLIGSGLNSAYEARLTVISGSFSGAATNVWLPLGITRSWSVTQSGSGYNEAQGTLQIRNAANGAVLTSSLLLLEAGVEI